MRISTKGRYSLEAMLYLALREDAALGSALVSTREIALQTGYSEGYLEQLFIPLRKCGIIQGTRGAQGGYRLAKSASQISAGEILRAVEGTLFPVPCVDSVESADCQDKARCKSISAWRSLYECIIHTVDAVTLADLVLAYRSMESAGVDYVI